MPFDLPKTRGGVRLPGEHAALLESVDAHAVPEFLQPHIVDVQFMRPAVDAGGGMQDRLLRQRRVPEGSRQFDGSSVVSRKYLELMAGHTSRESRTPGAPEPQSQARRSQRESQRWVPGEPGGTKIAGASHGASVGA